LKKDRDILAVSRIREGDWERLRVVGWWRRKRNERLASVADAIEQVVKETATPVTVFL
jgi:hypothetical protein